MWRELQPNGNAVTLSCDSDCFTLPVYYTAICERYGTYFKTKRCFIFKYVDLRFTITNVSMKNSPEFFLSGEKARHEQLENYQNS